MALLFDSSRRGSFPRNHSRAPFLPLISLAYFTLVKIQFIPERRTEIRVFRKRHLSPVRHNKLPPVESSHPRKEPRPSKIIADETNLVRNELRTSRSIYNFILHALLGSPAIAKISQSALISMCTALKWINRNRDGSLCIVQWQQCLRNKVKLESRIIWNITSRQLHCNRPRISVMSID